MPAKKKPFRTIKDSHKTGRLTREEVREAVHAVMKERAESTASGSARPEEEAKAVEKLKKKPFREILPPARPATHFTAEEARRAVLAVMVERGELSAERAQTLLLAGSDTTGTQKPRSRSEAA